MSTSSSRHTTSWQCGVPDRSRGGNRPTSSSFGSSASLATNPSGIFSWSRLVMRTPISSRSVTPRLIAIRRIEPNRLIATGNSDGAPPIRTGCSKSSARPPSDCFITRSAISHSSRSSETGRVMRASSPAPSSALMNARNVSNVTGRLFSRLFADVDRRDAKRERRPAYVGEAGRPHPGRQLFFGRKFGDRLRQISIGSAVATQGSADQRQHAMKIEVIENAHQRLKRRGARDRRAVRGRRRRRAA